MKHSRVLIFVLTALILSTAGKVFAQQFPLVAEGDKQAREDDVAAPEPDGFGPTEQEREETRKKIEAVRIMRLTEELKLDEKTVATFIPALTAAERKQMDLLREGRRMIRELRSNLNAKSKDAARLTSILDKINKNDQEMSKQRGKIFNIVREHLTVEQQARFFLFQHDFMRDMRGMIAGARGKGRGPGDGSGMMRGGQQYADPLPLPEK